jgi:hypothetical protein
MGDYLRLENCDMIAASGTDVGMAIHGPGGRFVSVVNSKIVGVRSGLWLVGLGTLIFHFLIPKPFIFYQPKSKYYFFRITNPECILFFRIASE